MALLSKTIIMLDGKEVPTFKNVQLHQKIHNHHILEARFPWQVFEDSQSELGEKSQEFLGKPFSIQISTANRDGDAFGELKFKGIVTGIKIIKESNAATGDEIAIIATSPEVVADDGPNYNCFHEMGLNDIVNKAIKDYSLDLNVDATNTTAIDYTVQHHESTYDFIKRLAEQYGQWFYYNGEKLVFGKPEDNETKLSYHYDLKEFNLSLIPQPQSFTYFSHDYLKDKIQSESQHKKPSGVSGKNDTVFNKSNEIYKVETNVWVNSNNDASTDKVLKSKAQAQQESLALNQVRISGSSVNSGVAIGNIITIDEVKYRVIEVNHSLSRMDNYENYFEAVSANIDGYPLTNINAFPISQSQLAIVKETNDPDGLGRIKVSFAWQDLIDEMTPWIRVVTTHAGEGQGMQFLPEKGDQVLVDFEGGDAECPYVVGALYHKGQKPNNEWASSDNDIKAIQTRSGHTIKFSDKKNEESITISDKKGNSITLDTKKGGITISSPSSLTLSSKDITINASNDLNISATNKAEIKALEITAEADTNFTIKSSVKLDVESTQVGIKGNATAKLEGAMVDINGSGMTNVKGGVVNLN